MTMMMMHDVEEWQFDVELEDNWVRELDAKASKRLLALLKRHHTYGTGEMVLPRKGLP